MTEIVAACIAAMVAVIGWFFSARQLNKQERNAKIREISLQYLIESFRRLEGSSNREYSHDSQWAQDYEAAIADIQLFGTAKQIALAQTLVTSHLSKGSASCDELLEEFRRDLRKELDLEVVPRQRMYVRIVPKE